MENRIKDILEKRKIKPATFANSIDVPTSTMYSITRGQTKLENIGIGTFIKIAQGLSMTAEELYYGESHTPHAIYSDSRQEELNGHYESLNENSKDDLVGFVKSFAADPDRRMVKDRQEPADNQRAMGA